MGERWLAPEFDFVRLDFLKGAFELFSSRASKCYLKYLVLPLLRDNMYFAVS